MIRLGSLQLDMPATWRVETTAVLTEPSPEVPSLPTARPGSTGFRTNIQVSSRAIAKSFDLQSYGRKQASGLRQELGAAVSIAEEGPAELQGRALFRIRCDVMSQGLPLTQLHLFFTLGAFLVTVVGTATSDRSVEMEGSAARVLASIAPVAR